MKGFSMKRWMIVWISGCLLLSSCAGSMHELNEISYEKKENLPGEQGTDFWKSLVPFSYTVEETSGPVERILYTEESPIALGLKGDLVANTPIVSFPPSLGGRTVALKFSLGLMSKRHKSHICEKPSNPLSASGLRYSGSKTIVPTVSSTIPLCLGTPNFSGKSE